MRFTHSLHLLRLNRLYTKGGDTNELDDVDDKALIYKLVETGYGSAEKWSADTVRGVGSKILAHMPSDFLRQLSPDTISNSIATLKDTKFENPQQAKSVADVYLEKNGVNNLGTEEVGESSGLNLAGIMSNLGPLAAFVNPSLSKEPSILNSIISACDKLNLPAPLKAVTEMVRDKMSGSGKKLNELGVEDLRDMGISVFKNGPPQLLDQAMKNRVLTEDDLNDIAGSTSKGDLQNSQMGGGIFSTGFFKGIVSFVTATEYK